MGYWKVKTEMKGTGGGRWGRRVDAKRDANHARRIADVEETLDLSPYVDGKSSSFQKKTPEGSTSYE